MIKAKVLGISFLREDFICSLCFLREHLAQPSELVDSEYLYKNIGIKNIGIKTVVIKVKMN